MNKKQKTSRNNHSYWKEAFIKLSDKYNQCDKSTLISMMTGFVFILLGLIQLIFIIFSPLARTFDHISLILVDFIIAAVCLVYVLYRRGTFGNYVSTHETNTDAEENTEPSEPSDTTRVCIPSSRMHSTSRSIPLSREIKSSMAVRAYNAENENLFFPRHRFSPGRPENSRSTGSRRSGDNENAKFNSRHTGN